MVADPTDPDNRNADILYGVAKIVPSGSIDHFIAVKPKGSSFELDVRFELVVIISPDANIAVNLINVEEFVRSVNSIPPDAMGDVTLGYGDVGASPTNHRSTGTAFGIGDGTGNGHVRLSDATDSTSGVNGGIAATPLAVQQVAQSVANIDLSPIVDRIGIGTDAATNANTAPTTIFGRLRWMLERLGDGAAAADNTGNGASVTIQARLRAVRDNVTTILGRIPATITQVAIDGAARLTAARATIIDNLDARIGAVNATGGSTTAGGTNAKSNELLTRLTAARAGNLDSIGPGRTGMRRREWWTPGSHGNWIVPPGITEIFVTGCGAGAPGRAGGPGNVINTSIGGGGGHCVIGHRVAVTPGTAIAITIGDGSIGSPTMLGTLFTLPGGSTNGNPGGPGGGRGGIVYSATGQQHTGAGGGGSYGGGGGGMPSPATFAGSSHGSAGLVGTGGLSGNGISGSMSGNPISLTFENNGGNGLGGPGETAGFHAVAAGSVFTSGGRGGPGAGGGSASSDPLSRGGLGGHGCLIIEW
jgi:hypothetical protein